MTFKKLISLIDPVNVYGTEPEHFGALRQDSREIEEGDVFIAVKGGRVNGHDFIDQAVKNGASVIICEDTESLPENVCVIQIQDTRSLLGPLAQAFVDNPAKKLTVIGITGTNGKTTTATLVYQALRKMDVQASLLGTVEKRIIDEASESKLTTADPIEIAADMRCMVEADSTHLVMEVSSHALQQKRIEGIGFGIAAFTNLSHDHLDYHSDMNEYAAAKKLLFDGLSAGAKAVINADDNYAEFMTSDCQARVIEFSFENGGNISCEIISHSSKGLKIKVDEITVESPLVGNFNAYNVAESFLICQTLGYGTSEIAEALKTAKGAPGRLEQVQTEDAENQPTVLVDYAHTPAALENVLQSLVEFKQKDETLHIIFGCGGDRDKTKRPQMAAAAEKYGDVITVTTDNPRSENPDAIIDDIMQGFNQTDNVNRITDRRKAIERAVSDADLSTIVLIAGKGHETYQEVKGVCHHFDDREVAFEALGQSNGNPKHEEVA